jgi:hypothetical protein
MCDVCYGIVLYCLVLSCLVLSCIAAQCHRVLSHFQLIITKNVFRVRIAVLSISLYSIVCCDSERIVCVSVWRAHPVNCMLLFGTSVLWTTVVPVKVRIQTQGLEDCFWKFITDRVYSFCCRRHSKSSRNGLQRKCQHWPLHFPESTGGWPSVWHSLSHLRCWRRRTLFLRNSFELIFERYG